MYELQVVCVILKSDKQKFQQSDFFEVLLWLLQWQSTHVISIQFTSQHQRENLRQLIFILIKLDMLHDYPQ